MRRRLPSLNALRAFEAAGRHGRMIHAAEELHVTHSAISRQVQQLEQSLGVALFEGPKNALRLTEAGRTLLPHLTAAFDQLDMAVRMVAGKEEAILDIACGGTFSMRWLIPRLHGFRDLYPRIEVRLTACHNDEQFQRGDFDVVIRHGTGPWPADKTVLKLFATEIGPVLAPSLARPVQTDFEALPILRARTRPHDWAEWTHRKFGPERAERLRRNPSPPGTEYEHLYFLLEAATAGLGVAIAPWPLVADDVAAGRLLAPHGFLENGESYVALAHARPAEKVAFFLDWLGKQAADFASASAD
ncbi:LysR substrate-binding domain-containing protein [Afifella pfennigii]|uniref:LysR substrate-binding domain-containing protein n=1 Tax=Afifella pfennigii TaxID=209897 RepID=UPI00047D52FF|nr:LysR substrate-binding domain-containing protein [Afifella pfennigii]